MYRLKLKISGRAKFQTQAPIKRWTEIIEDLWNKLSQIQNKKKLYSDERLKSECVNQQFGKAEDSESDTDTWVNKSTSDVEKSIVIEKDKISQNECEFLNLKL